MSSGVPPVCWTLGLCGRVMVVVVLPFDAICPAELGGGPRCVLGGFNWFATLGGCCPIVELSRRGLYQASIHQRIDRRAWWRVR